jgi:hypothetical protein
VSSFVRPQNALSASSGIASVALILAIAPTALVPRPALARQQGIALSDLYAARDIPAVTRTDSVHWRPPTPAYVKAHTARPELPAMRPEFDLWVEYLLRPQWIDQRAISAAPYLRQGTGRESRDKSHFYATYRREGRDFLVRGFLDEVQVTAKAPPEKLSAPLQTALARAVALKAKTPPNWAAVSLDYGAPYPPEVKAYLRRLAETYLNPSALPAGRAGWKEAFTCVNTSNGGFSMQWNVAHLPSGVSPPVGEGGVFGDIWTNGRAVVVRLLHEHIWAHDFSHFLRDVPQPRQVQVEPLNPQAVEFWDRAQWYGPDGVVDTPARATSAALAVVVNEPYAPHLVGEEADTPPWAKGRPSWGNQFNLPMTDLRWHIAEFAALASATMQSLSRVGWPDQSFYDTLGKAKDRAAVMREAQKTHAAWQTTVDRYSSLAYPPEVKAQRDEMLAALQDGTWFWEAIIAYWEPIVRDFPNADESFYVSRAGAFGQQLQAARLDRTGERLSKAANACGVPLYQKFGLENAPADYPK